jgi:undecaprenyl-diphosphatase
MNGKRGNYRAGPSNLGICGLLAVGALACIVLAVLASVYDTFPGDIVTAATFEALRNVWLDALFRGLTRLGDGWVATVLVAGTVLVLLVWRRWADGVVLAFAIAPVLLNYLLKELVARPRPVHIWADSEVVTFSFPSGHAVLAIYYLGFLIYLSGELAEQPAVRRSVRFALVSLVLGVGVSRVYLGVHWPSDVIGGYLLGGVTLLGAIWVRRPVGSYLASRRPGPNNGDGAGSGKKGSPS